MSTVFARVIRALTKSPNEYKLSRCASLKRRSWWQQGGNILPQLAHLDAWRKFVKAAAWRNLVEVRRTYPDTDAVKVRSGRQVLVFNIRRNDYRLIVAAHFNRQIVYTLRFLTHAEYSKARWKDTL